VTRRNPVALGLAPHSGWAAAVAVADVAGSPRVVARERIEMASPNEPAARQPYHTVESLPIEEAAKRLAVYEASATRMAEEAVAAIARRLADAGQTLTRIGVLESAGRKGSGLAATLASHALIHTADGDHFRTALAVAAERCGMSVLRVPARSLETEAAAALGRPAGVIRDVIRRLGRDLGPPWTADQKAAALLGWLALRDLSQGRRTSRTRR
jgi:hypothetical protein